MMVTSTQPDRRARNMAARRDMALVIGISTAAAAVCMRFDVSEAVVAWTRLHERLQLDEMPAVLLVFATCLIWFSLRRYEEARRQLELRTATEGKLADALAENQRLAQQYANMQEYERKELARDLHDELGQYLNVIKLDAVSIRDSAAAGNLQVSNAARAMIETVDRVYGVVRNLIRQLRPVAFDELGVAAAIEHCVEEWRGRLPAANIELSIEPEIVSLEETRALALFRLVQEALTNVARHAHATRIEVRIAGRREHGVLEAVQISIVDNGRGVDLTAPSVGLGLVGMRERITAFGGSLKLTSRPGEGFEIWGSLPTASNL